MIGGGGGGRIAFRTLTFQCFKIHKQSCINHYSKSSFNYFNDGILFEKGGY